MEVSLRGLPRQHITDSSSLSLNDHISKMSEREGWSYGVPVKPGLWRQKVKSILKGCSGFTGNSLPPNALGYIKASPVQISTAATKAWSDGSWKLKSSVDFIVLWVALEETSPFSHPAQTTGGAEHWDRCYLCGKAPCSVKELSGSPSCWSEPPHLSLPSTMLALLCASRWKPAFGNW